MGQEVTSEERAQLHAMLQDFERFADGVRELLTKGEIAAAKMRIMRILDEGTFPNPSDEWPPVPWPPI